MQVGKEVLATVEASWSAEVFRVAIELDASDLDDPAHVRSGIDVLNLLADHIAQLRASGSPQLRDYCDMLFDILTRFPRLARLRDLPPEQQIGVRIDALFQDLYAEQKVVTPDRATALLSQGAGGETRRRIMEIVCGSDEPVPVRDVVEQLNSSRQHIHQMLSKLAAAGLVIPTRGRCRATAMGHDALRKAAAERTNRAAARGIRLPTNRAALENAGVPDRSEAERNAPRY